MAKGKLILICQSGGEFVTNDDGTMSYNGGEANAENVTSETPFNDLKLNLAETYNFNQETVTVKYFLPGNKRNLITVKNDKDVKRMIDFHGDAITAEVFVTGTSGFNRSALENQTNRQSPTENDETIKNDNLSTKKDEKIKRGKVGPKKDKRAKKEDKVAKSPIASSVRRTRRSIAAAAAANAEASSRKTEKQKEKTVSDDASKSEGSTSSNSSSAESEQVNVNVDSDCSSDHEPSRYAKRQKVNSQNETEVNASPADSVKKRRHTPSWKIGANGRFTIVSDSAGSKSRGTSRNEKPQIKGGRLAATGDNSQEKKTGRKRGRPRAIKSDEDHEDSETLVSLWKSAITDIGQEFTNAHEFQDTLQRYAVANGFEFKLKKNNRNRMIGKCAAEGCSWNVNAMWVPSTESFKIKTMNNVHTCEKESNNWLLDTIKEKLQELPHLKPKEIAYGLLKDFPIDSNGTEVLDGKMIFREQLHGSDKDAYNKLPWFCEKIMETNPGSISKLVIGENKRFKGLFVSFYSSLCGFKNGCRPLLFLEATSMWSKYGEVILTANAIDGNDDFFPLAFAIVDVEDHNNWHWFLAQLKATSVNSQPITFVFDREKNLKTYILESFQDSHVGYSIYHLLESFKRNVKGPFHGDGKSYLPFYFLAAAHAVRLVGFKKSAEQIKHISSQAYDWVMQIEPQHWTTSSFKGERYNHIIDDVSGSLSKLMEDYQELPIVHKIDAIIRTMIDAIDDAKLDGSMWSTHLTPSKERQFQEESVKSYGLKVLVSSDILFEVREDSTHVVNISNWSCTCLGWKETGLPCRHALAVFASIGKNPYEFCSRYFTVDAYRLTYLEPINPVPVEKEEGEKTETEQVGGEKEQALIVQGENEDFGEKIEVEKTETEQVGGEKEQALIVQGENEELSEKIEVQKTATEQVGGEKEQALIVQGENEDIGEKIEVEKIETEQVEGEKEQALIVEGENEEFSEKIEVQKTATEQVGGEKEQALIVQGENEDIGEKIEVEKIETEQVEGEKEQALIVEGENEELGEKIEVEKTEIGQVVGEKEQALIVEGENEEVGEKIEVETETKTEKEEYETVEVEDEKGEKMEIEVVTWGENEEGGKVEGEKEEIEKDEGEKEQALIVEGENEEFGEKVEIETETKTEKDECEKVEVEDEKGEKMEIEVVTLGENEEGGKVEGEKEQALIVEDENEEFGEKIEVETETRTEKEECEKLEVEDEKGEKMEIEVVTCGENEGGGKVEGEKEEIEKDEGEKEQALIVEGENEEFGEKIEVETETKTEREECEKVEVEDEKGEKMEIEVITCGENGGKVEGEKEEIEKGEGEKEQALIVEDENEEFGEKIEVETETRTEKEECEKLEVEDEKGEKMEIEIENEGGKMEGEKEEIEKDEGEKGKIREEDDDIHVLVLPPIPAKPVDVLKEKMDWNETEVETKRTVTCTKCKQPGHNKKSCNLYQLQQAC